MLESELVKLMRQALAAGAVDLIHGQRYGLSQLAKHFGQIAIGSGQLAAAVDQEDDVVGGFERDACLAKDLAGDQRMITLDDATRIDRVELLGAILGLAIDAVPRNARLVADDRAARAQDGVEQGRLTDVGTTNDDYGRLCGHVHSSSRTLRCG